MNAAQLTERAQHFSQGIWTVPFPSFLIARWPMAARDPCRSEDKAEGVLPLKRREQSNFFLKT